MLQLNNMPGVVGRRKRIGRGGSRGGTSGRGSKGQNARSGGGVRVLFEGGQMPLFRRLPKRGFSNERFKETCEVVNVGALELAFETGSQVNRQALEEKGLIRGTRGSRIKILGGGELNKQLSVEADFFSASAISAIEQNKGKVQVVTKER
jgi:large subunit ribosomal protein L15